MRYELVCFIVGLILILLFFPVRIKTKILYNLFNNKGYASLYFYSLKVVVCRFKFKSLNIIAKTKKKEIKIDLLNENNQRSFGEIFVMQIIKKIRIKSLKLLSNFGFKNDMFITSMGGASLNIIFGIIFSIICSKKKIDNYEIKNISNNLKTTLIFVLSTSIQINLFVLLVSFIKSLILKFKRGMVKSYGN